MKNMRTLQKRIAYQLQQGSLDAEVTGITCDSRKVQPQNVFVCIRGNRMDGHVYAEEAVERGAAVLVAGTCGFGMGATPNAMANMQAICDKYSPSVKAYLLIPLVGSLFADFINSLVITFFINLL